jgi:excisionase family DNA binding protein
MAISKSAKINSGTAPKAKAAGARKHAASPDQPNRTRRTPAGTAKAVAGRSSTAGKKAGRGPAHTPAPSRGRRPAPDREPVVMPVVEPNEAQLSAVDLIINRGNEITIIQAKSSLKVNGSTLAALRQFVTALRAGPVSLLIDEDQDTEITSQEAADLLNVSRPYVIKLAREGRIAHRLVGNRHRFLLSDVRAFQRVQRRVTEQALAAMVPDGGYVDGDF